MLHKPPKWANLSHHGRYRRLDKVRRVWCRYYSRSREDRRDLTVHLDGTWIRDVPGFFLALGEVAIGPNGYFGGDLDALSDCLCGGFGILPPLTIRLSDFDAVRDALDGQAWCRWRAEGFRAAVTKGETTEQLTEWGYFGDGSPAEVARWTARYEAALAGEAFEAEGVGSFFDAVLQVVEERGCALIPELREGTG